MNDKLLTSVFAVGSAILGVAIVALLVSREANTGSVFGSISSSFKQTIGCALSPVTGQGCGTSVSSNIQFQ